MSVLVERNIAEFTWDDLDRSWEQALFSWDDAGIKDFVMSSNEQIVLIEQVNKNIDKNLYDAVLVRELPLTKSLKKVLLDAFGVAETYWDNIKFNLYVVEGIKVDDNLGKDVSIIAGRERFSIVDWVTKGVKALRLETVNTTDDFNRIFDSKRVFLEGLGFKEVVGKSVVLTPQEAFSLYDTLIKGCDGVLSNISINTTSMTLEDFEKLLNAPPNHSNFIEFKVGEYEYQDALVRISLKSDTKQSQPSVANVVMHVDIPDTDDKGEVEITDTTAPTKVYFNKFYYKPPSVNVTLKGGNTVDGVLIPNVLSTDQQDENGRYFEVELRNEIWSERKTGKIYWVSKGY